MTNNLTFAFWGYGSEYRLGPLEKHLRDIGYETIKLPDPDIDYEYETQILLGKNVILLTSAHYTRDKEILSTIYPEIKIQHSFLELVDHIKPLLTVFYPHDLATPLVLNEPETLDIFDLVLWPLDEFGYTPHPKNITKVGWTGMPNPEIFNSPKKYPDKIFFFSDFVVHRDSFGVKKTIQKLKPISEQGVAIKLPFWPGHEEFEQAFKAQGFNVIDAKESTAVAMFNSKLVVSNSISSISIEASLMGKPVLNMIEDYLAPGLQKNFIGNIPGCRMVKYADFANALANPPRAPQQTLKPFSSEKSLKKILRLARKKLIKRLQNDTLLPAATSSETISFIFLSQDDEIQTSINAKESISQRHEVIIHPLSDSNLGEKIRNAKGEYVVFCSNQSDFLSGENFAERLISRLSEFDLIGTSGIAISGTDDAQLDHIGVTIQKSSGSFEICSLDQREERLLPVQAISSYFLALRKSIFDTIQFDPDFSFRNNVSFVDFSHRGFLAGFKLIVCKDFLVTSPDPLVTPEESDLLKLTEKYPKIAQAIQTLAQAPREKLVAYSKSQVATICQRFYNPISAQAPVAKEETTKPLSLPESYRKWQKQRTIVTEEIQAIYDQIETSEPVSFHIIIRLAPNASALLADTLDSLNGQLYPHWHLDIVTPLTAPEGLQDIPCLSWHENSSPVDDKALIDTLISEKTHDWCLEIPAGAKLDPLYFWRLSVEIGKNKDSKAIFVDDDCFNHANETTDPRFKPGVNPAALESSDLAGPICLSRESWIAIGGASPNSGSPWFLQLLRLARHYGWSAIKHIPDVLISYPSVFPCDLTSCTIALLEHLDYEKTKSEIVPATGQSWGVRHAMPENPKVTIAIISIGRLDLLQRCLNSIMDNTKYPATHLELFIVLNRYNDDPELEYWLRTLSERDSWAVSTILTPADGNKATRCNAALRSASGEFTLLLDEEATISSPTWLNDLVSTCAQPGIGGTSPCLIRPEANSVHQAGLVLGMTGLTSIPTGKQTSAPVESNAGTHGIVAQLYEKSAMHDNAGYLNLIKSARDVSALSSLCMLVRTKPCLDAGGMDEVELGDNLADIDLSLKLREQGWRLIYQPLASIGFGDISDIRWTTEPMQQAEEMLAQAHARKAFRQRWWPNAAVDAFWNPNLSLLSQIPSPETSLLARWQYLPMSKPRLLARTLINGQGTIRLHTPLEALRKTGLAQAFDYPQTTNNRPISPAELLRLAPDAVIMQHYLNNRCLPELEAWHGVPGRPFLIYAMDDLLTDLDETNPFRKNISRDARTRLKQALKLSDRLVVSTDYLAESYRSMISDIRVVPNFLEQSVWLPLRSQRRTTSKPRIGWAGGSTHQGDLMLLKEIIEQTRHEADWIFFGMCPDDIRPLLTEYHPLIPIVDYPAHLASLNLDIAVAPLAPTPFNRGKSNLRLLEYGILGLPVVCTDIDPYQNSPACCVSNTPDAWVKALRERIHDADAREDEGRAMRDWVLKNFLLENNLDDWLNAHLPD